MPARKVGIAERVRGERQRGLASFEFAISARFVQEARGQTEGLFEELQRLGDVGNVDDGVAEFHGRGRVACLLRFQPLCNLARPEFPHRGQSLQLRRTRACLALFPVIDRLARHADQLPIDRCRKPELGAVRGQPVGTEAALRAACIGVVARSTGGGRCLTRGTLGDLAQFFFKRAHLTAQVGNRCPVRDGGLLEDFDFRSHFLASDTGDFGFEDGGDVWHGGIVLNLGTQMEGVRCRRMPSFAGNGCSSLDELFVEF
ncbi:hypothetical protein D9M68_663580 [compost metagenome]